MQAIEFDSVVQNAAIPLPEPSLLASGMPVRVVVMFEENSAGNSTGHCADAISNLCANPLVIADFQPLSRDEAHER
ncbi:conserved hypothetical protein [Candidatus Accumulibacter aalborgensis]|uniref:Uncharacterized protein n=1 Tax=Candidatus Accumulibacter aalborgensis TaxID=1860102 RepID=A0A1A8Y080_9PROT|nr:hypothetical protein [Candidatus Accumulibacter aalborgensis]SBT09723.1 conserved hypothetical protein [Candidatus Accumulibacter aalborgensis]